MVKDEGCYSGHPQIGADKPRRRSEPRSVSLADGHKIALIPGLISRHFSGAARRFRVSSAKMQRANFAMFQQLFTAKLSVICAVANLTNIKNKPPSVS